IPAFLLISDGMERLLVATVRRRRPVMVAARVEARPAQHRLTWRTLQMGALLVIVVVGASAWFLRSLPTLIPVYAYYGHQERVTAVAWSPAGKRIASGDYEGSIRIWDAFTGAHTEEGHPLKRIDQAPNEIEMLRWSPDGSRIAVGRFAGPTDVLDA